MTIDTLPDDDVQTVNRLDALLEMLGWNSAAVFPAGRFRSNGNLRVMNHTSIVVLTDPYPEYEVFVFEQGDGPGTTLGAFVRQGGLLSGEYRGVLADRLEMHEEALVVPLAQLDVVGRDERGIPTYTGDDAEGD